MQQHALGKDATLQSKETRIVQHFAAAEPLSTLIPTPQWKNYAALLHGMAIGKVAFLLKENGSMAQRAQSGLGAQQARGHARTGGEKWLSLRS